MKLTHTFTDAYGMEILVTFDADRDGIEILDYIETDPETKDATVKELTDPEVRLELSLIDFREIYLNERRERISA